MATVTHCIKTLLHTWSINGNAQKICPLTGCSIVRHGSKICKALYSGQLIQSLMAQIRFLKPIKLLNRWPEFQKAAAFTCAIGTHLSKSSCQYSLAPVKNYHQTPSWPTSSAPRQKDFLRGVH